MKLSMRETGKHSWETVSSYQRLSSEIEKTDVWTTWHEKNKTKVSI